MFPKKHRFIKNINKIIKEKLKNLNLKPLKNLSDFIKKNKRFYSTPCFLEGKKFFFKILITNEIGPAEAIRREIEILKFLSVQKIKFNIHQLVKYDKKKFPYWYLVRYYEGKLLGHFYDLYFKNKKYITLLVNALFSLQNISQKNLMKILKKKEFFLWQRDFNAYFKMVKDYLQNIEKDIGNKINSQKIYNFLNEKKGIFSKSPLVLTHGDFTLANFVLNKEKLIVTDWEQSHLDNFVYDLSHLWIQLWRYPQWQKKLVLEFMSRLPKNKIEEFKDLFRIVIISEALGELRWSIYLCRQKYKKGTINAALKTINNALLSFEDLINL